MHTTELIERREVARETLEFSFARPEGFDYRAGQTVDITLVEPPETDAEGNMRTFSLVSAPHEPILKVATRMRDTAFKRVLRVLPDGSGLSFDGPFGSFFLHENASRPAVFLAGGIGVTPFHSIITDAAKRDLPHELYLFFSNRKPEDSAYLDEFAAIAKQHERFKLIATMTDAETGVWEGERGYIDAGMLARHLPEEASPVYYLAGPQKMVSAMRTMLKERGVSDDDIRFEEFSGY